MGGRRAKIKSFGLNETLFVAKNPVGTGVKNLECFNQELLDKWVWRFSMNKIAFG